jgi:hypothetical protein
MLGEDRIGGNWVAGSPDQFAASNRRGPLIAGLPFLALAGSRQNESSRVLAVQ